MRVKYRLRQAAGLKQADAQDDRVGRDAEYACVDVVGYDNPADKHGVDAHAYHDEKALERQRQQPFQIVVANLPPFTGMLSRGENGKAQGWRYSCVIGSCL